MKDSPLHIMHVVGARPHFMKLAPIFHLMESDARFRQTVVHTGQHYDESLFGRFLTEFDLPAPDYDLKLGSMPHAVQIGQMLIGLDEVLREESPDMVLVYGDTNSTAAGAIATAKSNITLGHVEAGLREFDKTIPEEVNKLLIDAVSDLYFCPTATGVTNLQREGKTENVHLVGDVVYDLLKSAQGQELPSAPGLPFYFATCHRASNTDDPNRLASVLQAFGQLDHSVIFPIHPRTRRAVTNHGLQELLSHPNIQSIEPLGFWETQSYIANAQLVLTDSGGVVREAYFHQTPCVILDTQIEWTEIVDEGWARIIGPKDEAILDAIRGFDIPTSRGNALGDGRAAQKICDIIFDYLGKN